MDLEREFDRRIAGIHGLDRLDNTARSGSNIEERAMDTRHAEFQAMTSVFLGDDFDRGKISLVESLQTALHDRQAELYRLFEAQELDPEEYVELFNTLLADTFAACEVILGTENFVKLFGAPRSELAGFIDRETFLQANQQHEITSLKDSEDDDIDTSDIPPLDDSFFAKARLRMPRTRASVPLQLHIEGGLARRQKEIYLMIRWAQVELTRALQRNPTTEEVAEKTELTVQQIQNANEALRMASAGEISDPEGAPTSGMVETPDPVTTIMVAEVLSQLSEREQSIIRLYYWEDRSSEEIAASLGLTVSNVVWIRRRALEKLRILL